MNAPNILTVVRICSIPLIVSLLFWDHVIINFLTALIFTLASITDIIDGVIARRRNYTNIVGKLLDPLADKLLLASVLIMLLYLNRIHPVWVIILISREIFITGLRGVATIKKIVIPSSIFGKDKTVLLSIGLIGLILGRDSYFIGLSLYKIGYVVFLLGSILSIYSALDYLINFCGKIKEK